MRAPEILACAAVCVVGAFASNLIPVADPFTVYIEGHATVHDGDTIRVAGISIRLQGVDAEELDESHGEMARRALIDVIDGRYVKCRATGKSYNRRVATCYVGDTDIGAELIRRGAALDCERYSQGKYRALEPAGAREILSQKSYCWR